MRKKKRNSKKGTIFMTLGLLLMAAALVLSLYNIWEDQRAGKDSEEVVDQLKQQIDVDTEAIPDYYKEYDEMPTIEINGYRYIGILEIPSLKKSLPVMEEWDYQRLHIAPCRYSGTYMTDDLVIAGHNYRKHFSPIKWMDPGDEVYFINVEGQVYRYNVDNIEILKPTQVEDLVFGDEWDLSLFTCTTGGQARCVVRCVKQ